MARVSDTRNSVSKRACGAASLVLPSWVLGRARCGETTQPEVPSPARRGSRAAPRTQIAAREEHFLSHFRGTDKQTK